MGKLKKFFRAFVFALQCSKCPLYLKWVEMYEQNNEKECIKNVSKCDK